MPRNEAIPVAEAALAEVLNRNMPATARSMHEVMGELDFVWALMNVFSVPRGINAMRVNAVEYVLKNYGDAIGMGRDAEHVPVHTTATKAQQIAMMEQQRAYLDRKLNEHRAEYAQMTLEGDLEQATQEGQPA